MSTMKKLQLAISRAQSDHGLLHRQIRRSRERVAGKRSGLRGLGVAQPELFDRVQVGATSSLSGTDLRASFSGKKGRILGSKNSGSRFMGFTSSDRRDLVRDVVDSMRRLK